MELMDLDLCTGTASSDGGGGDTAAAPQERVVLAIGMILVGVMLQQGGWTSTPILCENRKAYLLLYNSSDSLLEI